MQVTVNGGTAVCDITEYTERHRHVNALLTETEASTVRVPLKQGWLLSAWIPAQADTIEAWFVMPRGGYRHEAHKPTDRAVNQPDRQVVPSETDEFHSPFSEAG